MSAVDDSRFFQTVQPSTYSPGTLHGLNLFTLMGDSTNPYLDVDIYHNYVSMFENLDLNHPGISLSMDHLLDIFPHHLNIRDDISGNTHCLAPPESLLRFVTSQNVSCELQRNDTLALSASDRSNVSLNALPSNQYHLNRHNYEYPLSPCSSASERGPQIIQTPKTSPTAIYSRTTPSLTSSTTNSLPDISFPELDDIELHIPSLDPNVYNSPDTNDTAFHLDRIIGGSLRATRLSGTHRFYHSVKKRKCREMDPESIAKREKHNEMEKVRRRLVSHAFSGLAHLLQFDGSKKISKATVLQTARHTIEGLSDRYAQIKARVALVQERRKAALLRAERFIPQTAETL